jgi:hypothetical protein
MPLPPGITRTAIVNSIQSRIISYNRTNFGYNNAYSSFLNKRNAGIIKYGGLENWLSSPSATNCIMDLLNAFGMNARNSKLKQPSDFLKNLLNLPKNVNLAILSDVKIPTGGLSNKISDTTPEKELRALFDYCEEVGKFSESGGYVIGSKVCHCILPDLCPMLDGTHIAISLSHIVQSEYLPPYDNWISYLGHEAISPVNPSPQGAGRYYWDSHRFIQAIGFIERIYWDWQIANNIPGRDTFLNLDPIRGTSGVPRVIDKVLW